jgi:surface carbohydrate biosynthesis protein
MSKHRLLYMPVETKSRELLGKTFLAARAVERGWIVVMGVQRGTRKFLRERPPGVYVAMSIPDRKTSVLQRIQKAGHRIINLGEENLFYTNPEDYCVRKLGPDALKYTDLLLVPGERNAGHVREYRPEGECKMAVTGNPRFDVLQPDLRCVHIRRAEEIRRELGRFVLVNTNFARVNPFSRGLDLIDNWRMRGLISEGEEVDFLRRHAYFKQRQMAGLQALLKDLPASPAIDKIVVRPHPGENHDVWRAWAKPLGIEIRYEGSANDWIMAAEAVLHPGCTTGIEALLLDRPVFSYVPEPDGEFINEPDLVSEWVTSADQFVEGLSRVRGLSDQEARKRFAGQRDKLRNYIVNTEPPYAADRIVDALDRLDVPFMTPSELDLGNGLWQRVVGAIRARKQERYARSGRAVQKLGDIQQDELRVPLTQWAKAGVLSRVPRLTRVSDELWALY